LADETLLPITLNSLPKNTTAINITMGYPLKDVPVTSLIFAIFQLFISQEKLQKSTTNQFYHKDVIAFLKHQSIYNLIPNVEAFSTLVANQNQTFITKDYVLSFFNIVEDHIVQNIFSIFKPIVVIEEFIGILSRRTFKRITSNGNVRNPCLRF